MVVWITSLPTWTPSPSSAQDHQRASRETLATEKHRKIQNLGGGGYLEGGEHRDFPPAEVDCPSLEFLKCTSYIESSTKVLEHVRFPSPEGSATDSPVLKLILPACVMVT